MIAKVLANRMTKFLPDVIDEDQTGYIKGRFIGTNIRLVEDTIHFTQVNDIPGILLAIDFEKAFDSLSWEYIYKCLEAFNFGPKFIQYIKILYTNISTAVINNGHISNWFSPERGVRQGCPISPYLFILAVETLACKIRISDAIKGIHLNGTEVKISQLADDTTCLIKDIASLKNILMLFEKFKICAGLSINIDKTIAMGVGGFKPEHTNMLGLSWTDASLSILGVTISGNENDHYLLNYKKRLKNLQHLLNSWRCRHLSLKGKVTVINTLALSPLIYLASVIHVPEQVVKEVKQIIIDFFWDNKTPKIAYNVLIQNMESGGLKLTDFESKIQSLKIGWIKRLTDIKQSRWKAVPKHIYKTNNLTFYFKCNQARAKDVLPKFYADIHNAWSEINTIHTPSAIVIKNQVIWNNRYLTIQKQPYFWSSWMEHNILTINDLLDDKGVFLGHEDLSRKFGINCNFLQILQIRQSIPLEWRTTLSDATLINTEKCIALADISTVIAGKIKSLVTCKTREIYQCLIKRKAQQPTAVQRWEAQYPEISNDDWKNIYTRAFKAVRETKIQTFQYKILHRIINCNKKLFDMKIKDSPVCSFCNNVDSIEHFFFYCQNTRQFWEEFFAWSNGIYQMSITNHETVKCILFGLPSENDRTTAMNFCLLYGKYFIYKQKLFHNGEFHMISFLAELKYKLDIEERIANKTGNPGVFEKFRCVLNSLT